LATQSTYNTIIIIVIIIIIERRDFGGIMSNHYTLQTQNKTVRVRRSKVSIRYRTKAGKADMVFVAGKTV